MEGNGYIIEHMALRAKVIFEKNKSYSVIALNLETVEDVEKVIRQCELLKEQIDDGLTKDYLRKDKCDSTT